MHNEKDMRFSLALWERILRSGRGSHWLVMVMRVDNTIWDELFAFVTRYFICNFFFQILAMQIKWTIAVTLVCYSIGYLEIEWAFDGTEKAYSGI